MFSVREIRRGSLREREREIESERERERERADLIRGNGLVASTKNLQRQGKIANANCTRSLASLSRRRRLATR